MLRGQFKAFGTTRGVTQPEERFLPAAPCFNLWKQDALV